jgi:hypothetical protein
MMDLDRRIDALVFLSSNERPGFALAPRMRRDWDAVAASRLAPATEHR